MTPPRSAGTLPVFLALFLGWTTAATAQPGLGPGSSPIEGSASGRSTDAPAAQVHLVATGGTISNRDGGRLTAEELARSMPGLERFAQLTYEQFANVASSQLTVDQWLAARQTRQRALRRGPAARRHRRHQRHRHARRDRVFSAPDRPRPAPRRGRRIDAQSEHARATRARRTCSKACASRPSPPRATRACSSS